MIMNMNEKGRQTKLLAAIVIIAMVVCAFTVVMPSEETQGVPEDYTPTSDGVTELTGEKEIGSAENLLALAGNNDDYGYRIVVGAAGATLVLTANITSPVDVGFILNGDLTIKSKDSTAYTLNISTDSVTATSGSSNNYNVVVYANADSKVTIDNAKVGITNSANSTAVNTIFNNQYEGVDLEVIVKNGATLTLAQTGTPTSSGSAWLTYTGAIGTLTVDNATVTLDNIGSFQANVISVTNNAILNATMKDATLTAYLTVNNSKVIANDLGLYSANIVDSEITATNLGIYSGSASGQTINGLVAGTVSMSGDSSIMATNIVNGLSSTSTEVGKGSNPAIITGSGTVSGTFGAIDSATSAFDYKIYGIELVDSTIDSDVYANGIEVSGTTTVNSDAEILVPTGATISQNNGATISNSGTITNLGSSNITVTGTEVSKKLTGATTEQTASSGSAVADMFEVGYTNIKLGADVTIPAGTNLVIGSDDTLNLDTHALTIADGDNLTINGKISSTSGTIKMTGESVFTASIADASTGEGASFTISTTVDDKTSSIKFTNLLGGDFSVSVGSVDTGGDINFDSNGNATVTGDYVVSEDTNIKGGLVLEDNATVTVRDGVTLTVKSITGDSTNTITLYGALTGSDSTPPNLDSIIVKVYSTGSLNNTTGGDIKYTTDDSQFEFKGKMDQNITVSTEQSLTGDLYIPTGYTLTIASGGILNMAGFGIYVEGTLAINANGAIKNFGTAGGDYGNKIILWRNGEIQNSGVIGSGCDVTITAAIPASATTTTTSPVISVPAGYAGAGSVTLRDVSGISFDVVRGSTSGNTTTYNLGISGNVSIYGMGSYNTIAANDVKITDDLSIGTDVTFSATNVEVQKNVEVTVTGDLDATGGFTMVNGSTVVIYGKVDGDITAQTGTFGVNGSATGTTDISFVNSNVYVTNIVLTVGQYNYVDKDDNAMTDQRLYVSGTAGYVGDATTGGKIKITNNNGLAYIPENATLALGNIELEGDGLTVLGQIQYTINSNVKNVNGTQYSITDTTDKSKVNYYYTTFDAAYDIIDTVDRKTLTVYGGYTVEGQLELTSGQSVIVSGGQFNVAEDGTVDIRSGASITTTSQGSVQKVDGVLTVYSGGVCPQPKEFAVKKTGTDFIQYSGLIPALNNAQSGDVIDVVNNATLENSLTINEGVTVNIDEDVVMTFEEDLMIAVGATLNNDGTIKMTGNKSTITVNGTLNSYDGAVITFVDENDAAVTDNSDGGERAIYSTGTTVVDNTTGIINFVNAAYYTNEDNYVVLTSFASANTAVAAQDAYKTVTLNGTFTERADVTIAADTNVVVAEDAKVTLGNVTMPAADTVAQTLTVNGTLTATIIGATGAADATSESSVALDRASGITFTVKTNTVGSGATTAYMFIGGVVTGNVTIASGTVNADVDSENFLSVTGDKNSLTVAQGATIAVDKVGNDAASILVGSYDGKAVVSVDGTISFNGGALGTPVGAAQILDVNGTMTVGDETNVTVSGSLNIAGTLEVSTTADKAGTLSVNGVLIVGTKPTTVGAGTGVVTGAIDTNGTSGYIKAYAGADLTGALIDYVMGESNAESTAFVINGWTYMTIYAEGGVDYTDVIGTTTYNIEKFELAGFLTVVEGTNGYNINDIADWYTDAELTQSASDAVIGTNETLYFKVNSAMVPVTISVGEGISLYIDGIRYQTGTYLSVGTHTVSATVNPGFKGDVTIQFCGQTVTDSFTITPEMASNAYEGVISVSASGNITQDSTVVIDGGSSGDSGMGLTDYLLIILVILIVIMAIIVALRLMRS